MAMAKNKKNQSAAIRFGPALKASFLCLIIAGSAVGYVWQKSEIYQLGLQFKVCESHLKQLRKDNENMAGQVAMLRLPLMLDQRVRALGLGLAPAQPGNIMRLTETSPAENKFSTRRLAVRQAVRQAGTTTQ
jgi:hypothetical protein